MKTMVGRLDFAGKNPAQHYQTVQILLKYELLSHNDVLSSRKHQFYQKVKLLESSPRMEEHITNEKLLVPGKWY